MSVEVFDKQAVAKSFGKAASSYDSVAHFQRWVGESLLKTLPSQSEANFRPKSIMDLGCGTGYFSSSLLNMYDSADYFGLDLSEEMIRFARQANSAESYTCDAERCTWMTGDAELLPLKSNSIDLVFSSLSIQWCGDLGLMFEEVNRVLKKDGVFVFSTLLEGSLSELKDSWSQVDESQHVNEFSQLKDYQDAISDVQWDSRKLSTKEKVLKYQKVSDLTKELKRLGAHNMTSHRSTKLTGKQKLQHFVSAYERFRQEGGLLPATYQVLFGVLKKK